MRTLFKKGQTCTLINKLSNFANDITIFSKLHVKRGLPLRLKGTDMPDAGK